MANITFYYGCKGNPVDFNDPETIEFHNGSVFMTSLKEAAATKAWPTGNVYHCTIRTIPRSRRLKEDSEPNETQMLELMRLSSQYQRILDSEFAGKEKFALTAMMDKSRTGAIVDLIRQTFYRDDSEFCEAMVHIGYDGYYGKFHPPANFHTDKERYYYARIFDLDRITVTKIEDIGDN